MRTRRITDRTVRNFKPGKDRREVRDPAQRGLYVLIQPSGSRGYCVRYRRHDDQRPRKYTLPAGILLEHARKLAADCMFKVALGEDPAGDLQRSKVVSRE